jgi:nucleotide-binding universal stress UspA family protein
MITAGRPVLLVPDAAPPGQLRIAAIAWKDVPEAARAVTAAMPLLEKLERVFVFNAGEDDQPGADCTPVVRQLEWHGITAEARHVDPKGRDAAEAVLDSATAVGCQLLVMGAYGRNRMTEFLFGSFTTHALANPSLPILLFH